MEAHSHFSKAAGRSGSAFSSRKNSLLVALLSAVLAGVLIYLFVSKYSKTTVAAPTTTTVYVATREIPAGTPEAMILADGMIKAEIVPASHAVAGAISDPSAIAGQVASVSVGASQQILATEFRTGTAAPNTYLTGDHRAVAVAMDTAHGLTAYLSYGDYVDVIAQGNGGTDELFQDVPVLGNEGGNVLLDLTDSQALDLANAEGAHLTLWFELRPVVGATNSVHANYVRKL